MLRLLLRYAKPYRRHLIALIAMTVLQGAVQLLGLTREMKSIVDSGIGAKNTDYLMGSGLRMLLFTALVGVLGAAIAYAGTSVACGMRKDMTRDCYHTIVGLSSQDVARLGEATLITRCISDTDNVQRLLGFLLSNCLLAPVVVVLMLASLWQGDLDVFLAEVVAVGLSVAIMLLLMMRARRRFPALQASIDHLNLVTKEKITGVRTIRAFGREDFEAKRGEEANRQAYEADIAANRPLKFVSPAILTIMNASMVLVYWIGAAKAQDGLVELSTLLLTIQYVNSLISPLSALPIIVNMIPGAEVGCARIGELLDTPVEGGRTASEEDATHAARAALQRGEDRLSTGMRPAAPTDVAGAAVLAFDDVSFGYNDQKMTLSHLSFAIRRGERVAVVGATGSGKSTLLALMCGLYEPQQGVVRAEGVPIGRMGTDVRIGMFSYVPQKAMVFQDTVLQNIRAYNDEVSDDAVSRACEDAVFSEVIAKMEDGLATRMAQGGMNLSGGQRKRLSLARGLAKDAQVYLLDDPFAALDAVTERSARLNTLRALDGKTVVMVTQRFSAIADFDKIIVMRQGVIDAIGTHEELLATCEEYADMYRVQGYLERG